MEMERNHKAFPSEIRLTVRTIRCEFCKRAYKLQGAKLEEAYAVSAAEREGNKSNGFENIRRENGSSQGQILALTVLCVPNSLDSGLTFAPAGAISQALAVTLNP